jgi:hypothetical protein
MPEEDVVGGVALFSFIHNPIVDLLSLGGVVFVATFEVISYVFFSVFICLLFLTIGLYTPCYISGSGRVTGS